MRLCKTNERFMKNPTTKHNLLNMTSVTNNIVNRFTSRAISADPPSRNRLSELGVRPLHNQFQDTQAMT